jgi:hypothetical protein
MIAGSVASAVASGLMVRFRVNTSTAFWAVALVLAGMGFGLAGQQCMMVPQTILGGDDIALGTSVVSVNRNVARASVSEDKLTPAAQVMFAETLSGSVFLAVCENLFETRLIRELEFRAPNADPAYVIASGASGLRAAMSRLYDAQTVDNIIESFVAALQPVWTVAVVLAALSVLGSLATEWVSVKGKDGKNGKNKQDKSSVEDGPSNEKAAA